MKMKNKIGLIIPDWQAPSNVRSFSTVRYGGTSTKPYHGNDLVPGGLNLAMHVGDLHENVEKNRGILRKILPSEPFWLEQVHGTTVIDTTFSAQLAKADASIATQPGKICVIQTADCLPVLLSDITGTVVAAAHAGWRGLAGNILENTISKMQKHGAKKIIAWLGPAIGPEKFEVGKDVVTTFLRTDPTLEKYFYGIPEKKEKYLADIYSIARAKLQKSGVNETSGGNFCTVTDSQRFYSYRRDGITGRMATCIWIV